MVFRDGVFLNNSYFRKINILGMEETDARKLVAFSVIVYNLVGAFVISYNIAGLMLVSAGEFLMAIASMPVTFISLIYLGNFPDFWYPVILVQVLMLGINLYLADATVRYFQR